jgi:hypothetical protein
LCERNYRLRIGWLLREDFHYISSQFLHLFHIFRLLIHRFIPIPTLWVDKVFFLLFVLSLSLFFYWDYCAVVVVVVVKRKTPTTLKGGQMWYCDRTIFFTSFKLSSSPMLVVNYENLISARDNIEGWWRNSKQKAAKLSVFWSAFFPYIFICVFLLNNITHEINIFLY